MNEKRHFRTDLTMDQVELRLQNLMDSKDLEKRLQATDFNRFSDHKMSVEGLHFEMWTYKAGIGAGMVFPVLACNFSQVNETIFVEISSTFNPLIMQVWKVMLAVVIVVSLYSLWISPKIAVVVLLIFMFVVVFPVIGLLNILAHNQMKAKLLELLMTELYLSEAVSNV